MFDRFDPHASTHSGALHSAANYDPEHQLLAPPNPPEPPALQTALAPMSQNVPKCPTLQKSSPTSAPPDPDPIDDLPDYQPAQPPAPDDPPLSDKQRQAIHLLLQGLSDTAVAKRLGLNRRTLHRWKWHHPRFYNTLDEAQRQAWNDAYGLLRTSVLQSALKLNHLIKKGKPQDAIKAAKVLLSAPVLNRLEQ
jgi:hypothetical protein